MNKLRIKATTEEGQEIEFDVITEEGEIVDFAADTPKETKNFACLIGLHAWFQGTCVNCGKKK